MMNDEQRSELTGLLGGLCEDRLTIEAARRLEQLVCEDEAARRHYVQYMRMVADLQGVASQRSGCDLLARVSTTGGPVGTPRLPVYGNSRRPNLFSRWDWAGMDRRAPVLVFGVLMLAVGLLVGWRVNHRQSGVEPAVVQKQHSASRHGWHRLFKRR